MKRETTDTIEQAAAAIGMPARYDGVRIHCTLEAPHGDFADVVLIVAGLHAAAALAHHYLLRDPVLRRMLP